MTGGEGTGRDGADRRHPVRIHYGDFGQTSQEVRDITGVMSYHAKFTIDFTANEESLEFIDLVAITEDGFVTCGTDWCCSGLV